MGTRAFLFTDIEDSTKLWSDTPTAMPAALARHDELITTAVVAAGGQVFKHTGDGICAVFTSASDAVTAAAAAQRSLTVEEWGDIGRLRVRMAVHAGDAEPRGDDWSGPALNRTARLTATAHGGQVLVSSSAYELASDTLDHDIAVADLGTHSLRGLARAEHVWQLIGEGLRRSFPPLRSLDATRGWLPTNLTSFVGRESEFELVAAQVRSTRLVMLVGPGGVGKTRLAAEVGKAVRDQFPDGVWIFELAGLASADGLEALIMATIGLSVGSSSPPREALMAVIRRWRALFIVDNCEHVSSGAADLIAQMIDTGPDLVVLATSRERLRVPGERVVVLEPLSVDRHGPAVQLFIDRANSVNQSVAVGPDADAVTRVCRRLDGMPLAIELAAARTMAMTPVEIERRLDQRFRLLSAAAGSEDRHGSLERVLDWSYDLLRDECQTFFARLSLFAGSFDASAAGAVAWPDEEFGVIDMLEELVAKSLLTSEPVRGYMSFRLLETMRQYGEQRLSASEVEQVLARHSEYFAAMAEAAWDGCRGRDSQRWLDLLDAQLDDVRAAFERASATENTDAAMRIAAGLFMYNQTRRLQEIFNWVDEALALPRASEHRLRHQAALHRAYGKYIGGAPDVAEREIRDLLDDLSEDDPLRIMALIWLTGVMMNAGRFTEASALAESTVGQLEQLGSSFDYDRAEALWNCCAIALVTGAPNPARARQLLALAGELGSVRALAGGLVQAGAADPDPVHGAQLLAEARDLSARSRDNMHYGGAINLLGALQSETDAAAGLTVIRDIVEHSRRSGLGLLLLQTPRSYFGAFSTLGRYETIATLDGIAVNIVLHPAVADAAIDTARDVLGTQRYEELKREGRNMTIDDLAFFLLAAVADL